MSCALCLVDEYVHTFSLPAYFTLTHVHHAVDQREWTQMIIVRHTCCVASLGATLSVLPDL